MVNVLNIHQVCPQCKGVGEITTGSIGEEGEEVYEEVSCPMCDGAGELLFGRMGKEE